MEGESFSEPMGAQGIPAKAAMTPRDIKDGPFCWQSKAALRTISESCGDRPDKTSILAVYLALTWEASNQQSETFTVSKRKVAEKAGVCYRKAADSISLLCKLGVMENVSNICPDSGERLANTYTLGTICPTPSISCPTLGMVRPHTLFSDTVEESGNNLGRIQEEGRTSSAGADSVPAGDAVLTFPTSGRVASWSLTADFIAELTTAHPGLDVNAQCKLALAKIRTGAVKPKTARGMPRFIWSWMARANDAPQGTRQTVTAAQLSRDYRPI